MKLCASPQPTLFLIIEENICMRMQNMIPKKKAKLALHSGLVGRAVLTTYFTMMIKRKHAEVFVRAAADSRAAESEVTEYHDDE